ncbi:type I-F CRISPR-associated endoribonuclease Cas6/Csy4 [Endozoicomonas sp. SCSIO W0465]|uniref:type I-F CRISPR-associated endoribonuclease Cas6/Csy4 n=1 Tax=Endozoicomonas sp. SCSIO W0465 TaxID=2918516 RepID=UPI002075BDAD|nr:type I-F CRISPR-associated endoribonuclease Cas6/Csy4 [Endozoicomonas sp. SCSIO W0465]USE35236.1 type I-F CRISPR-associated endoribonuclease Cas6/Csy4 [Endozoicomonas sp. SCSIO W0465]
MIKEVGWLMKKSYYFELFQPESLDELETFHQDTFRLIHNHSEPYNDPISNARYRSWVGLSYPKFGRIDQYYPQEFCSDHSLILYVAIKHPSLFVGDVVHCVSTKYECLEMLLKSEEVKEMVENGVAIGTISEVPTDCQKTRNNRDRRPERRSKRYIMKKNKRRQGKFNLGKESVQYSPTPIMEPLPRFANLSNSNKDQRPIHINQIVTDSSQGGWYSVYGLSKHGSTVPKIPVDITIFSGDKKVRG